MVHFEVCSIVVFCSTLLILCQIGVLDSKMGARDFSGISIYLTPVYTTLHLVLGLLEWLSLILFVFKKSLVPAVCNRRIKHICCLFCAIYVQLVFFARYQNWLRFLPSRVPTSSERVLVFDASVGRLANLMINFLWLSIRAREWRSGSSEIHHSPGCCLGSQTLNTTRERLAASSTASST